MANLIKNPEGVKLGLGEAGDTRKALGMLGGAGKGHHHSRDNRVTKGLEPSGAGLQMLQKQERMSESTEPSSPPASQGRGFACKMNEGKGVPGLPRDQPAPCH